MIDMKNIVKILSLATFVFFISSCEMDLVPTTAIELEKGFKTYDDAEKFANGMHSKVRALHYGIFSYTSEVQGDMFNAAVDYGNRNGSPHRLDGSFTTSDYNLRDVWQPTYNALMNINAFLANIENVTPEDSDEADNIDIFKGWAYFYRAYCYHELVRRYAPDYEPATANDELGVPLILKFDITEKPARASIQAVYDQILVDLDSAESKLTPIAGVIASNTPTIDAVKALQSRVNFYMHNYEEAAILALELINSTTYELANDNTKMQAEFVNDNGKESIMQMYANLTEWGGNANTIYLNYVNTASRYTPDFVPTKTCINMYEAADLRRTNWFEELPVRFSTGDSVLVLFKKYPGNPALFTPPTRNYRHQVKLFRIAEMYLIAAEALVNQTTPDAAGALSALNALQAARGTTLSVAATMDEIKKEWAKETIGEGFRIDCLRRWKDGFVNRVPQSKTFVNIGTGFNEITVTSSTAKLTWAIPQTDIDVNPNLFQNTGW